MDIKCVDIFKEYALPFETYFTNCINHDDITHEDMEIIWVIRGSATVTCNQKRFMLTAQTVILIYTNTMHSISSEEGSIIISYRLKKDHLLQHNLFFEKIPYKAQVFSFDELSIKYHQVPLLIVQIIKLLISEDDKDNIRYKITGYYNMFIYELHSMILKEKYMDIKTVNYDEYLNRIHTIVEYTYEHFREKISLKDLSKLTNVSEFRLSHFVSEVLGVSYRTFLQNSRFECAIKMLKETDMSIIEISKECGFSEHKYLNKIMKKRYMMTPLKYRKMMLEEKSQSNEKHNVYDFIQELKLCISKMEDNQQFRNLFGIKDI